MKHFNGRLGVPSARPTGRRRAPDRALVAIGLVVAALLSPSGPPNTARASSQPAAVPSGTIQPQHAVAGDPVIAAAGDIACQPPNEPTGPESQTCRHFATADLIGEMNPAAVLPLGDLAYNFGRLQDFTGEGGYNDTWGRYSSRSYPVPGDNEYEDPDIRGAGYSTYWKSKVDKSQAVNVETDRGYYSFDLGAWHVIALNSELPQFMGNAAASAQVEWLRADLADPKNKDRCTLAYFHRPLFSTGDSGSGAVVPLAQALYDAKADVILAGHAHRYERYEALSPKRQPDANGFVQLIVGTGGKSINPIGVNKDGVKAAATGFGVLKMILHADSYDWEFVNAPGSNIQDSGTAKCVGPTAVPVARPSVTSVAPASLPQGATSQTVTVSGSGFTATPNVSFGPGIDVSSVTPVSSNQLTAVVTVAGGADLGSRTVTVTNPGADPVTCSSCFTVTAAGQPIPPTPQAGPGGYWLVASDGGMFAFGDAVFKGSTGAMKLNKPIMGMAPLPTGKGYWLVASDGGIFSFGDAVFHGSTGAITLNKPVVGMAATPSGKGYWLVASDGGIFAFGDAVFFGSTGAIKLNQPIGGMAATPSGKGYWLVASDGGIFAFGDAPFKGSTGAMKLNKPVVGMAATPSGQGYWLVASDGGIFAFGNAVFKGSTGNIKLNSPVVGLARSMDAAAAGVA